MKSTISIDAAPTISNLFIHEQIRSERFANIARIFFAFVYIAIGFVIKNEVPQSNFDFLMMGAFANLTYALFVCILSLRKQHYRWLKYLSTTLDIVILSGLLYAVGTFYSFKSEAFLFYFIWIALSTIRFSPRLTFTTGFTSLLAYAVIIALAWSEQTVEFGTITESFTTSKVSLTIMIMKLGFLGVFTAVAVYISKIYHTLVTSAIGKVLVDKENTQLSKTLRTLKSAQKDLHNANRTLRYVSEIDSLSKLYNRRKTEDLLSTLAERANMYNEAFSIILLDIDLFKRINDEFGHPVGDAVIMEISANLKGNVRDEDAVGRWGGEEFLIVCPGIDSKSATGLAERLRKDIQANGSDPAYAVTCSFGVTEWINSDTAASIVNRVDKALYLSKENGRNCVTML